MPQSPTGSPAQLTITTPPNPTTGTSTSPHFTPVAAQAQTVQHTASRHSGPRRWLRAVEWALTTSPHPQATPTTLALAQDLAARMDYDTGHVRYAIDRTITRTGMARSTITKHAKILREMGLLAWVSRGSKTNIRRLLGLPGYAATATVYAAVIPPAYDRAMSRRRIGTGYQARVVIDHRQQVTPSPHPQGDRTSPPSWTPSLTVVKEDGTVKVESGFNNTSRKRASRSQTSTPSQNTKTSRTTHRTATQVARDIWIARQVRPRVTWTQTEPLRRLAYALRPLIDQGLNAEQITTELHSWYLTWRPARPAAYIRAHLSEHHSQRPAELLTDPHSNPHWQAMCEQRQHHASVLETLASSAVRTDDDRRTARARGWHDFHQVADHYTDDPDDALDLYGTTLCARAIRLTASSAFKQGTS
ncbi:hypothetical protein ACH4U6_36180 [Streptomyces netropsis]|uniref:hypothetical protein n=1 Tax=Streptomyces netropsis TaxID=55404 RepID=UPI0037A88156